MFTGIVENFGEVLSIKKQGDNITFFIKSMLATCLKVDQSVSHDGVCLTVESIVGDAYTVTAIKETLEKTTLKTWLPLQLINLERCLIFNGRIDGHLVQGHVDTTAICRGVIEDNGSWVFQFSYDKNFARLLIEKGSICVNGISLTVFDVKTNTFSVAIIPFTYEHTNMKNVVIGSLVNLEFDMIGKYIVRHLALVNTDVG